MIEVYSKDNCKYCVAAKNLLVAQNKGFTEIKLDRDITRDEIIAKFPTARTFPVIVVDGEYIGGYDQLKDRIQNI